MAWMAAVRLVEDVRAWRERGPGRTVRSTSLPWPRIDVNVLDLCIGPVARRQSGRSEDAAVVGDHFAEIVCAGADA